MKKEIVFLTGQNDQTNTILSSVCIPFGALETISITNELDPELFLSSRSRRPDCVLINSSVLNRFPDSFPKALAVLNQYIPVVMLLPFADPDLLLILLDNKLFNYMLFPISVNKFRGRIEEIIALHYKAAQPRDSFYSHPYFSEFRHELLNHITIAKGYVDLLCTSLTDDPDRMYSTKVSESIQKIHSTLFKK